MSGKHRQTPPRFSVGNRVVIGDAIASRLTGDLGTVTSVQSSRYNITLDRYSVRMDSGLERLFWDIQLQTLGSAVSAPSTR